MLFLSRRFSRVRSATTSFKADVSRRRSFTSPEVAARAVSPANRRLPASRNSLDQPQYIEAAMPSRRQSSEMFSSPRSPSSTLPPNNAGGSDAECPSALVLPALCPARISVSSSLLAATMNQKSSLREVHQFVSGVLTGNNLQWPSLF